MHRYAVIEEGQPEGRSSGRRAAYAATTFVARISPGPRHKVRHLTLRPLPYGRVKRFAVVDSGWVCHAFATGGDDTEIAVSALLAERESRAEIRRLAKKLGINELIVAKTKPAALVGLVMEWMGRHSGDDLCLTMEGNERTVKIEDVRYEPARGPQ